MFKFVTILFFAVLGFVSAKPQVFVSAPVAEVVAAPVVSSSSQYVARNFNGVAAAHYVAESPVVAAYSAYTGYPSYSAYSAYPSAYSAYPSAYSYVL